MMKATHTFYVNIKLRRICSFHHDDLNDYFL